jgi:hypothetical protein
MSIVNQFPSTKSSLLLFVNYLTMMILQSVWLLKESKSFFFTNFLIYSYYYPFLVINILKTPKDHTYDLSFTCITSLILFIVKFSGHLGVCLRGAMIGNTLNKYDSLLVSSLCFRGLNHYSSSQLFIQFIDHIWGICRDFQFESICSVDIFCINLFHSLS